MREKVTSDRFTALSISSTAHEDDDRVAADEHAHRADREQRSADSTR